MKKTIGKIVMAGAMAGTMALAIGLSGCGTTVYDFVMPENGYDGSKVTITFASTAGQGLQAVLDAAIERFAALYPNITVEMDYNDKDWGDLQKSISTKLTGGNQPNLAVCYSDHVASYNVSGVVLPLDEYFLPGSGYEDVTISKDSTEPLGLTQTQVDDYISAFYKDGQVYKDNHTYTLPLAKSTEVLFYNKTKFIEWGIVDANGEPFVPDTWDEMEEVCKKIIAKADKNDIALGYDSEANLFITWCEQFGLPYTQLDGNAPGGHYLFNTPEHQAFVDRLRTWNDHSYLTTKETYGQYSSKLFTAEGETNTKCYMSIGSTGGSAYQLPTPVNGKYPFDIGIAPIPQAVCMNPDHEDYNADLANSYKPKTILQGPNVCIFKKKNPQEVIASWLLVKFLTTDPEFQGNYSTVSGYSPVTESIFKSPTYQGFIDRGTVMSQVAQTCYDYAKTDAFFTSPAFLGSSVAREQVGNILKTLFKGTETVTNRAFEKAIQECSRYRD